MPLRLAVLLLSAAAIGYEILLIRLFSIVQWHRYAFMIISLALLGYGASGAFLTLARRRLEARFASAFALNAALFALLAPAAFAAAQRIRFNPLEAIWDPRQFLALTAIYLTLATPFFCAANCIGLALGRFRADVHRVYRADLAGAGCGAVAIVVALYLQPPDRCLLWVGAAGFAAGAAACLDRRLERRPLALLLALAAAASPLLWPQGWLRPRLSEYKGLAKALLVPGVEVVAERSGPLGSLAAVRSRTIPFRHAPGLSLDYRGSLPDQIGVFTDGDGMTVIDAGGERAPESAYLDYLPSALPYRLLRQPRVLVLGAGGGSGVVQALRHRAAAIDAVEYDPNLVALVRDRFGAFAGHIFGRPEVRVHVAEARAFVSGSGRRWDLIQIPPLESLASAAAGARAVGESYVYTREAFEDYLRHLRPGGFLAVNRWLELPPRDTLKLFATAVEALERSGVRRPGDRLVLIRSWAATTLLVRNGDLTAADVAAVRRFCDERAFDLDWIPGIDPEEADRFNVLDEPYLLRGAQALLGDRRAGFIARYKFDLRPATDDRPYFFHFFKWSAVRELLALRERGGAALVEWGYLVQHVTLAQAFAAGLVVILLPLAAAGRGALRRPGSAAVGAYFACLGVGFLFVEIAFIQRLTLYLGHPIFAIAVALASFLLFAGIGSGWSLPLAGRVAARGRGGPSRPIGLAVCAVAVAAVLYLALLPPLLAATIDLGLGVRIGLAVVLIAPLAFLMGMPFPLGLQRAGAIEPAWIPWAWGINGWASVVSAVAAPLLAVHFGFRAVVVVAAALYLAAGLAFRLLPAARE